MKKKLAAVMICGACIAFALAGCGGKEAASESTDGTLTEVSAPADETDHEDDTKAQEEPEQVETTTEQKEESEMGTKVNLKIGDTVIPATLNNTVAAQEFIKKLPFTVSASKGEFDYCGMGGDLKYDKNETQAGWKNGDIGYARGWFALFHGGEDQSSSYTSEMIIGHIDDEYLETVRNLPGSVTIVVELAE